MEALLKNIGPEHIHLSHRITLSATCPYSKGSLPLASDMGQYAGDIMWKALGSLPNDLFLSKTRLMIEVRAKDGEILWEGSREMGG